jgi:o-succinylbenzoate synthase
MYKISDIKAFAVSVPMTAPVKMAGIVIHNADNLIVRVTDSDGVVGWGEAASAPTMTGETPEGMVAAAKFIAARIVGAEIEDTSAIPVLLEHSMYGNESVKAAFEIALLDLIGKKKGVPVYELIGNRVRASVPVIFLVSNDDPQAEIADVLAKAEAGFITYKVKVGVKSVETDLARCRAIRDALGADVCISADANQGYSPEQALQFAKSASDVGIDFFEQPVPGGDLQSMLACAKVCAVPIGADEGIHSIADITRHHELGAAAGGSLKPIKLGGMIQVMTAGKIMQDLGMQVNLSGKVADTSIASAAIAHLGAALPQVNWDANVANQYILEDVVAEPLPIIDGHVAPPDRPGLGVDPIEERLQHFTSIK